MGRERERETDSDAKPQVHQLVRSAIHSSQDIEIEVCITQFPTWMRQQVLLHLYPHCAAETPSATSQAAQPIHPHRPVIMKIVSNTWTHRVSQYKAEKNIQKDTDSQTRHFNTPIRFFQLHWIKKRSNSVITNHIFMYIYIYTCLLAYFYSYWMSTKGAFTTQQVAVTGRQEWVQKKHGLASLDAFRGVLACDQLP